jgi:secreted Zn-dependent insulinase-like peptidase
MSRNLARARWATRAQFMHLGVIAGLFGAHVPSLASRYAFDEQRLAVALYPAYLAGLRWSFGHGPRALTLSAHGFSERLPALVSTLLRELLRWDPTETARLFEAKRELQTRQLRSHSKRRADELAYYFLGLLLRPRRRPVEESLATLESMGLEELRRVHEQTVGTKLATRALTFGNLDERAAAHQVLVNRELLLFVELAGLGHDEHVDVLRDAAGLAVDPLDGQVLGELPLELCREK